MEAVAHATCQTPPELIPLPIPSGCDSVWALFLDLNSRRGNGGMGPSPIAWSDLLAWQQLMGVILTPWEIDTLMHLDIAALSAQSESTP